MPHYTWLFSHFQIQNPYFGNVETEIVAWCWLFWQRIQKFAWISKAHFNDNFIFLHIFRSKTINLEKLKLRLLHDVDSFDNESKSLSEYRREMELLQQEKMAHVEELRQIHADINAMETVIKQVWYWEILLTFYNSNKVRSSMQLCYA